ARRLGIAVDDIQYQEPADSGDEAHAEGGNRSRKHPDTDDDARSESVRKRAVAELADHVEQVVTEYDACEVVLGVTEVLVEERHADAEVLAAQIEAGIGQPTHHEDPHPVRSLGGRKAGLLLSSDYIQPMSSPLPTVPFMG